MLRRNGDTNPDGSEDLKGDDSIDLVSKLLSASDSSTVEELRSAVSRIKFELLELEEPDNDGIPGDINVILSELDQIIDSQSLDRAVYYLNRLTKGLKSERVGKINDINLNRWKEYSDIETDSLWYLKKRDKSGAHNASYWGNFIPQIPYQLITRFTKKNDWVLDTFVGSGTTLIECRRQGRNGIGFDLSVEAVKTARTNISMEGNPFGVETQVVNGDSTELDYTRELAKFGIEKVQLVIMHPPYWDIIKFSESSGDLSNAESLDNFLEGISKCAEKSAGVLEKGRHLALVIGDKYSKGEWIPLGFRSMDAVLEKGFRLKSIIVKNFDQTKGKMTSQELWRYRALAGGFYVFKHEYIFLFEKL